MDRATAEDPRAVPPEEVERRIAEYRRIGLQRRIPAQVVYPGAQALCPWPGCGLRIVGIVFQLDQMGDPAQASRWLASWWNGPGLVGRCPGCGQYVLFDVTEKRRVEDPADWGAALLPENWHQTSHLVTTST